MRAAIYIGVTMLDAALALHSEMEHCEAANMADRAKVAKSAV